MRKLTETAQAIDIFLENKKQIAPELLEALEQLGAFVHSVEHEGVVSGRVVDAVKQAKDLLKKYKM